MRKIIASLDIGSNSIKLIVAEVVKNKTNILAVSESESKGIKDGLIINKEAFIPTLKDVFKKCEEVLGLKIKKVIVTVPSNNTEFMISEGSTTITSDEKIVKGIDIVRAMQASVYNRVPKDLEIVSIIPTSFKINQDLQVKNPLNMNANQLSVKTVVAMIPRKNIYTIVNILEQIGVEAIDVSLTSMGDYYCLKNEKMGNLVGAVINIGEDTTTISIFNKGVLTNTKVLEIGGQNIDNDISFIYKVTKSDARMLKENLGLAHKRLASASTSKFVTNKLGEKISINQYELSEVIESRLEEILNLAKKEINHLTKKEIHYIMVTGGTSEMPDFELTLESVFGHNAKLAKVYEIGVRNNKYSTSLGLIKYYNSKLKLRDKEFSIFSLEEQEDLSGNHRKINISDNPVLGKLFGYFFDN
jgi:cell division protein FtsA